MVETVRDAKSVILQISITTQLSAAFIDVVRNKEFIDPFTAPYNIPFEQSSDI
jgi:hypothetical protein